MKDKIKEEMKINIVNGVKFYEMSEGYLKALKLLERKDERSKAWRKGYDDGYDKCEQEHEETELGMKVGHKLLMKQARKQFAEEVEQKIDKLRFHETIQNQNYHIALNDVDKEIEKLEEKP